MQDQLTYIEDTNWSDVWERWREREEEIWRPHYEALGKTWESWRSSYQGAFQFLQAKTWKTYRVNDPTLFVPPMWIGGFKGWKKYLPEGADEIRFEQLVENPEVQKNEKVIAVMNDFPSETEILALQYGDEFVCFEGMHRCSAIALAAKEGRDITNGLLVSVATLSKMEEPVFEIAKKKIVSE